MIGINTKDIVYASLGNTLVKSATIDGLFILGSSISTKAINSIRATFVDASIVIKKVNTLLNLMSRVQANAIDKFIIDKPMFAKFLIDYDMQHFETPRLAIDANDEYDERKWLIRAENNYTDWYLLDNVLSQTNFEYVLGGITPTNNFVSKVGNTAYANGTIVKFFIPTTMPTGYSEWFADGMTIYINGQQVIHTTAYHNNRKDVAFDFSPYIKLNEMNYIILRWWGSGNHGFDFGLLG